MTTKKIVSHHIVDPEVVMPGSKYLANRYIALAAIANGETVLRNLPQNDDIEAALDAVGKLGATVRHLSEKEVSIRGIREYKQQGTVKLNCRDSGTLSRFVTALASNLESETVIDASKQMRQRPMAEVAQSLRDLGVEVSGNNLPIKLKGPLRGGTISLDTSRSSQYLSALLIASLKAKSDTRIKLVGKTVSSSYVELTKEAIKKFGGRVEDISSSELLVKGEQYLSAPNIDVAGDVVSSSYFMVAALLGKTSVTIRGFDFNSPQGESLFYGILSKMGAEVECQAGTLKVSYTGSLRGTEVDMGNMPDVVPTLVVLALFVEGITHITNIAHLAFKESNRIVDLCEQLNKLGAEITYSKDSITVTGGQNLQATTLSSCHDHRLAMSFALIGIRIPGIVIEDAQAVEKSFPLYWDYLEKIGIEVADVNSQLIGVQNGG
ncbi:3-phosphoshikimate 1-carboxyvinyltransferase [Kangiella sediminilitoris]|uniref:3-phosphoshikimate 1-carboxyvinyltransferase n=1 Tax=Kangiella sediminilitoris TaxID=1144748 RepID=A0A1B3BBD1_9GAMM|nr:3-phosphoshikimate 1-carboxyvinyltransferase [Kangiella sediminilitoris]AOE50077.1 3-phosphoshikimate 1-carboxyvinyltransferase [Kangiella sediminilitoris]